MDAQIIGNLQENDSNDSLINKEKIRSAIQSGSPISVTTYTLSHEMEEYMGQVLSAFLTELGQPQLIQYLGYCLNELITNAKKANTKRIYFKERHLEITDVNDYNKGMETFKEDTLGDIKHYLRLQKQAGLYVKFILQTRNGKVKLEVRNNSQLTVFEYKRIHDKLSRAQQYTNVNQAMSDILDESEGAGLGLIIMVLMLEKVGLTEENFQILCENGETITRIILPLNKNFSEGLSKLSKEFAAVIEALPKFPESVEEISRTINDPESQLSDVAEKISQDISLAADLLKLVNSASFGLSVKCRNILDAVRFVGFRGIQNLILSVHSLKNLNKDDNEKMRSLWEHSRLVASFSYNLAKNFCKTDRNVIDDSYICGLLHDMGKTIFESVQQDYVSKLKMYCAEKDISPVVLEKIMMGFNHGEIGALIAEKWNFPESIMQAIRYHHEPDCAPHEYRKLARIIYLADMFAHFQAGEIDFYQIDTDVLSYFHITGKGQFEQLSEKLAGLK